MIDALAALRELVAVEQEREEISRLKQRRACTRLSDAGIAERRRVQALHDAWKVRNYRAWNVARAVIQRSST